MAEELIGNLGYETPQSATKYQKLPECILTRNSSYIWARFTLKISSPNLVKKKWKNFLTLLTLSGPGGAQRPG